MKLNLSCTRFSIYGILLVLGMANCDTQEPTNPEDLAQSSSSLTVTPTDPDFFRQTTYDNAINLPQAWSVTTGSSGIVVAIIDSGKVNHPDLNAKWFGGYDFFKGTPDPTDTGTYHHGIHVAGIIGASANNGIGGAGICWECKLMPIKVQAAEAVYPDAPGYPGRDNQFVLIARGIRYAIGEEVENGRREYVRAARPADVINISIGNLPITSCDPTIQSALDAAYAAGVPVVAAASNVVGTDRTSTHYLWPNCNHVIAVTAANIAGNAEPYATVGSGIALAAPGGAPGPDGASEGYGVGFSGCTNPEDGRGVGTQGVASTWMTRSGTACYRYWAGTSMATPHVSGVVALMRSVDRTLNPDQIRQILQGTAKYVACSSRGECGAGMVDAYQAVKAARFSVSNVNCETTGGGSFACDASAEGGLAPYTITWSGLTNASINPKTVHSNNTTGTCSVDKSSRVQVTVSDALGRTVAQAKSFICWKIVP